MSRRRDLDPADDPLNELSKLYPCTCDGSGFVFVPPSYPGLHFPEPPAPGLEATEEELNQYGAHLLWLRERRKAAAASVYPCRGCNMRQFVAWQAGCFRPNHRPCATCTGEEGSR